jgi:cupin fold WbuC family metalloprotein
MLVAISKDLTGTLIGHAKMSERKRKNYNFHSHDGDKIHRMLHAMHPGTYVQPHKHENPDKREVFIILEGKVVVVEFSDIGEIINSIILEHETGNYGVEIPERTWHMLIALQENSVVYEVKNGPWSALDDKCFAPWAPKEGEAECQNYLHSVLERIRALVADNS